MRPSSIFYFSEREVKFSSIKKIKKKSKKNKNLNKTYTLIMLTANVLREKFKQNLKMLKRITPSPAERILKRLAWQKKIPSKLSFSFNFFKH